MNIFIYFSTYIIIAGFLYYLNLINYNPFIWLLFAFAVSIFIALYSINDHNYNTIIKYLFYNSPKLLLLLIIDKNNIFKGFIFYSTLFFIYLILIDFNLYHIYYNKTILKIINNQY
jgi:hypothetical protein